MNSKISKYAFVFITISVVNLLIIRGLTVDIFKYSTVFLAVMFVLLAFGLKKIASNGYEAFFAAFSFILVLFVFNVFFPVFVDRSISYHIVMKAAQNPLNIEKFSNSKYVVQSCLMRFPELEKLGLVKVQNGVAYPTKFGEIFSGMMNYTGDKLNKKSGYYSIKEN